MSKVLGAQGVLTVPVIDMGFFERNILYRIATPGRLAEEECRQPFVLHSEWFPAPGSRNSRQIALARGSEFFGVVTSVCSADISVDVYMPVAPDMGPNVTNIHAVPFIFKAKEIADGLVQALPVSVPYPESLIDRWGEVALPEAWRRRGDGTIKEGK